LSALESFEGFSGLKSLNVTMTNASMLQFRPNITDFNWTTGNVTSIGNISAVNQTASKGAFRIHNNGTFSGNLEARLNHTLYEHEVYANNESIGILNSTLITTTWTYIQNTSLGTIIDIWFWGAYINANVSEKENFIIDWRVV